jgi:hypothetical protein
VAYRWEGVVVEADPVAYQQLVQNYKPSHEVITVNAAITAKNGAVMFSNAAMYVLTTLLTCRASHPPATHYTLIIHSPYTRHTLINRPSTGYDGAHQNDPTKDDPTKDDSQRKKTEWRGE